MANSIIHSKKLQFIIAVISGTMQKVLFMLLIISPALIKAQNIFPSSGPAGIGTVAPDVSASLDISSTTKGILIPRMTKADRDNIHTPATGLMIYQTNSQPGFYYYNGSAWTAVSAKGVNKSLSNLAGPTAVNVDLLPNANNAFNLGSSSLGWKNIYAGNYFIGTNKVLDLSGVNNTFVGNTANAANTGTDNFFSGFHAGMSNVSGSHNVVMGANAFHSATESSYDVAIGDSALYSHNSMFGYMVAVGYGALNKNTSGYLNTSVGGLALYANTTGNQNTGIGAQALYQNQTGYNNTATGTGALLSNTTGNQNVANGSAALYYNVSGSTNSATGFGSMVYNTTGSSNTANGVNTLAYNTSGNSNVATGAFALFNNLTGDRNTANGYQALYNETAGNYNVAIGAHSLFSDDSGSFNTGIGDSADVGSGNLTNATAVGAHALVSSSNALVLGSVAGANGATNSVNVGIGLNSPGASLHIKGQGSSGATSSLRIENSSSSTIFLARNDGKVGIGTSSPLQKFHVADGSSGGQPDPAATIVMEKNWYSFFQMMTPDLYGNGINFGLASNEISGRILYNYSVPKGFQIHTNGGARMRIDSMGRVSIGNFVASHRLHLNVDDAAKPATSTWIVASDARLKSNISDFKEGLDVVKKIHPVWFEYNGKAGLPKGKRSVGILAQEMQRLAPYMIGSFKATDELGKTDEYLDYNANALFYILVNSVKELSVKNDELSTTNERLQSTLGRMQEEMSELKIMMQTLQQKFANCSPCGQRAVTTDQSSLSQQAVANLEQNIPNPFSQTTRINYTLPPKYLSAKIIITDKSGKVLKQVNLSGNGKGSLQIDAATLASGAYHYSLYMDGKLIASKQMEHLK